MSTTTESPKWECTDPDAKQYGRQLSPYEFEFKEGDARMTINVQRLTVQYIEMVLNHYYYTLFDDQGSKLINVFSMGGTLPWFHIAEHIFKWCAGAPARTNQGTLG